MKLFKKLRKGFTLIELVVVIAVVAILAAVSVVSYVAITNKAKQSNDQQKIDQVNLSLASQEISGQPKTMYDAVQAVDEDGFSPDKFKEEAKDYKFAYSMKENRFVIVSKDKVVYPKDLVSKLEAPSADLWLFSDNAGTFNDSYSHYLRGENLDQAVTCNAGLDVGKNSAIPSVTYSTDATQEVVIRTNGGTLAINAENSVVKHYGEANVVDIQAIAPSSYHEFGKVSEKLKVAKGRVVVEQTGSIPTVEITSSNNNIAVETSQNIVVSVSEDVEAATLSNVSVSVSGANKQVVVDEKISNENVKIDGQTASPEKVTTITKVASASALADALSAKAKYIMLTSDFETTATSSISYSMTLDGAGHTITSKTGASKGASSKTLTISKENVEVQILSLRTVEVNDYNYGRGLQLEEPGIKLTIKNSEFNAKHYGINFYGGTSEEGANDCEVNIYDSCINGWGALNIWSYNLKLYAENSIFDGYNDKVYNDAGWNGFGTIVLEGDTTSETTKHAENCELIFKNCTVCSASTTGNSQYPVLFNKYSKNNVVKFIDSHFSWSKPNLFSRNDGSGNGLYINGTKVVIGPEEFTSKMNTSLFVINEDQKTASGKITLNYNSQSIEFDFSTVTGQPWTSGTDYVFDDITIDGTVYSFDFDVSSSYEGGWTLYLSANIEQ